MNVNLSTPKISPSKSPRRQESSTEVKKPVVPRPFDYEEKKSYVEYDIIEDYKPKNTKTSSDD